MAITTVAVQRGCIWAAAVRPGPTEAPKRHSEYTKDLRRFQRTATKYPGTYLLDVEGEVARNCRWGHPQKNGRPTAFGKGRLLLPDGNTAEEWPDG